MGCGQITLLSYSLVTETLRTEIMCECVFIFHEINLKPELKIIKGVLDLSFSFVFRSQLIIGHNEAKQCCVLQR